MFLVERISFDLTKETKGDVEIYDVIHLFSLYLRTISNSKKNFFLSETHYWSDTFTAPFLFHRNQE